MTILRSMARYINHIEYDDLSPSAVHCAQIRLLDYIGTAFHGSCASPWEPMLKVFMEYGHEGESTVIANGIKLPSAWAAMLNTYPHMSEGSRFGGGHCAWVAMPAAIAIAERQNSSGKELILAIVIAYEIMLKIGKAIYPAVDKKGFQTTTVHGPIGAAAVTCKLLGLDEDTTLHALSIASSMSGGLKAAAYPYPLYCLQTGRATEAGIMAALGAQKGLKGNVEIMEQGFLETFGNINTLDDFSPEFNGNWAIEDTFIKIHFGCRHTHSPVDGCLDVMTTHHLTWRDIKKITIITYPLALDLCNRTGAKTATDAVYDMKTIIGLAVVHGDAAMHRFGEKIIASGPVQNIVQRIDLQADPQLESDFPQNWPALINIKTKGGQEFVYRRNLARGEPEDPIPTIEIEKKFNQLASSVLDDIPRGKLLNIIYALPELDSLEELFVLLGEQKNGVSERSGGQSA